MASTSASSVQKSFKYDVFLSFRGEDVRKTFVDHLYHALVNKGIVTYKDDEKIDKGERIKEQLIRSIQDSRFHMIVFSKNYASSSWCLNELVEIMECQKMTEHTAYPIFYDVEPTEVRNQSGAVGEAFAKHVRGSWSSVLSPYRIFLYCRILLQRIFFFIDRFTRVVDLEKEDDVGRWRNALKEAAGLAGMELKNTFNGHEAKIIQKIVQDISLRLHFTSSSVDSKLVGMQMRVKNVVSSLETGCDDVRMIGIKGMGGGGKTTLARSVFNQISISFEGRSFVENVREVSKGSVSGLKELQIKVLSDVLNDQSSGLKSDSDLENKMKMMMRSRKVLVVLDDVDDIEQLEALAGELSWFKPGSRIIITTRDEQVLVAHGVQSNYIHDVNLLSQKEAICLFSRYAFKREIPNQGYEELSRKVVQYAAGLPLTIKVLGSHLCGRSDHEWVDAIERLKTIPLEKTLKRLEISYNGLENDEKEIFLDVVCMLKGETKDEAIRILESCGYNAEIGLRVLEQKSLITISDTDGLRFHDHIEEMGWNIVRRLHPDEPSRHSRLWIKEEIEDILVNKLGTEAIRSIKLKNTDLHPDVIMKGLSNMRELRFLYVGNGYRKWKVDEASQYLPDALRFLYWPRYPFHYLPKTFRANKLVNLEMVGSNIFELWEGGERKGLSKLRFVDLRFSSLRKFDLGMTPNIETLDIGECSDFGELHMPADCRKLKSLKLSGSKLSNLNLSLTPHLETLDIEGCNDFVELQMLVKLPKLKFLDLGGSKLTKLNLGMTPHLERLDLRGCNDFVELHMPVECPMLNRLYLGGSKVKNINLVMTPNIMKVDLRGCNDLIELHMPIECFNLRSLTLRGSKLSNLNLGMNSYVESLDIKGCDDLVELCMPIECPNLTSLSLSGSKVSELNLGLTPHLHHLNLEGCYYLHEMHAPVGCLKKLVHLNISGCSRFENFVFYKDSELSNLGYLAKLELIAKSLDICPLHPNSDLPKFQFKCKYDEPPPLWSGNVEKLISFGLCACTNLEVFSESICGLHHLGKLTLEGSFPEAPKDLYRLESLEELTLSMKEIKNLPDSICMMTYLKYLNLRSCWLLEQLPKDVGQLECLEELQLTDCISLRNIPDSICKMKCLKILNLSYCILVEKLPEELGSLECLKVLNIEGVGISCLPQSIFQLKDLHIIGSRWWLESHGFTSLTEISRYTASYHLKSGP